MTDVSLKWLSLEESIFFVIRNADRLSLSFKKRIQNFLLLIIVKKKKGGGRGGYK